MAAEERQRLTWEAATERFLDVSELTERERPRGITAALEAAAAAAVNTLSGQHPSLNYDRMQELKHVCLDMADLAEFERPCGTTFALEAGDSAATSAVMNTLGAASPCHRHSPFVSMAKMPP